MVALLSATPALAQDTGHEVTGQVTSSDGGDALPGVNVSVKGTTVGTATGVDGHYELTAPSPTDTLLFSFIGFERLEVAIDGQSRLDVQMTPEILEGEEVVVVGYVSQRQRELSSAISTVTADELNPVSTVSVNQMLRGKAPGLNMQARTAQPGGGVNVNIRGATSPNGNNTPLYVIDGVPITEYESSVPGLEDGDLGFYGGIDRDPLSYLNPNDIESITVLKDASAAAIYGSAAANGVVLITTKSGQAGDIQVSYSGSYTAQTPHDYFPLMNAQQFMQAQSRLAYDRYLYENNLMPYGTRDPSRGPTYTPLFTEEEITAAGDGTDWLGLVTDDGYATEHNLSLRGGTETTRAFASFNFRGNNAVLRGSSLDRYSGRLNLDQTISEDVRFSLKMTASRLDGDNSSTGTNDGGQEKYNMLQAAYAYAPTVPVYDENEGYAYTFNRVIMNPAAFLTILDDSRTTTLFATPSVEIDLTNDLKLNVVGQANQETTLRSFYLPRTTNNFNLPDGMAQKSEYSIDNYSAESYATYTRGFGSSDLTVVAGVGYYRAQTQGSQMQGVGFATDAYGYDNIGAAQDLERNLVGSWRSSRTKLSQFGRLNYTFNNRYILSLVARRDGSSIFAENNKYGIFPGISAAWILSEEPFLRNHGQITQLKVRAGYGQTGNENVLQGNALQLYSSGYPFLIGGTVYDGVALSQVANPNLTWETVSTLNLGVDFGFWRSRLRGSVDYFIKTADDLLDFNPLPSNNAVGRVADNVGTTRSQGFELALHTINFENDVFEWSTDLNVANYRSYWVERNPQVPLASYVEVDDPLGAIYGWETAGIIQSEEDIPAHMPEADLGNVIYVDQDGNDTLNVADVVILGNSTPRWDVGFNNTIRAFGFDLNVFVYGKFGFDRYTDFAPDVFNISQPEVPQNTTDWALDVWSVNNPGGTYPGVADNPYWGSNPEGDDFTLEDASFLRISNVALGYSLPERWLQTRTPLRNARIFINVQDLGVITDYSGFDPEYTEANPYPKYYSTTFGMEINY